MTFILKLVESEGSPVASDCEHSLYADIVSVHFSRNLPEGGATAHVWLREPVKTAEVPGFVEVEKHISFNGMAYVMNEAGKTVSSFTARMSGSASTNTAGDLLSDEVLCALPYECAAALQRYARATNDFGLLKRLRDLKVAVDA